MASSKKITRGSLGSPPSHRRSRTPFPASVGSEFAFPAAVALDINRIQAIWENWYRSGVVDRPWNADVCLALLSHILQKGLVDWSGLEEVKPMVLAALERWKSGDITLEEFQARIKPS